MSVLSSARWVNLALVLLAVSAVLGLVWTAQSPTRAELEVRRGHLLPIFRQEDVRRIEVKHGSRRSVLARRAPAPAPATPPTPVLPAELPEVERDGDEPPAEPGDTTDHDSDWSLTEPFETDADPAPVDKLLGSLRYATWEREVAGALPLGLDAGVPGAVLSEQSISIEMGAVSYRLRLGQQSVSPPGSRYVEVSGGGEAHVYVVKRSVLDELFVDAYVFRGRQIVPYRKSSVARLILSSAAGVRRLRRVGDDFHFDEMQEGQRARRAEVERIFWALARASADPVLELEAAKGAIGAESSVRVAVLPTTADKPEASLEFGGVCPEDPEKTIAVRSLPEPLAGCVDRSVLLALREPASSLIDSRLFALQADEVDTVQIVEGEHVLDFARRGDGFVLRQPREAALDAEAAKDRLSRLLGIDGTLLLGRDKPANASEFAGAVVTLESSARPGAEHSKETVRVGAPRPDGSRWVYREADGAVVVVPREEAFALRADSSLLKDHRVFDYAASAVRGVEIKRGSLKQSLKRNPNGGLSLLEPKGLAVDGGLAVELIDQLRTLRAVRWVSDAPVAGFGLEKPRVSVRLQVEMDGREIDRFLVLGRTASGGYYASVDRDPGVFVAPRSLDRAVSTLLLDRSIFSAERDSIVELSLVAGERGRVLLKRVAGQLTIQKGSSSFDAERVEEMLDVIETLRPEAAVHIGAAGPGEGLRKPVLSVYIRRQAPASVGMPPIRFNVGSRDSFQDASIYYARHASVNATYALPRQQVERLLDLF